MLDRNLVGNIDYLIIFYRNDAQKALDVMAENVSVYKAVTTLFSFNQDQKNAVIRANVARIVDSIIVR